MLDKHSSSLCNGENSATLEKQQAFATKKPFKTRKNSTQNLLALQILSVKSRRFRSRIEAIQTLERQVLIITKPSNE